MKVTACELPGREPFVTVGIDPAEAELAKSTYPRYVEG